jgi:hypothetical protein
MRAAFGRPSLFKGMKKYWGGVVFLFVSSLFFFAAHQHQLGGFSDEPLFILLAQSLWHGQFHLPLINMPITDPLPGYPILLALPVHFLGGHWNYYFLIGFSQTLIALYFSWRLAREFLSPGISLLTFLLISINPTLLFYSGTVFLDTAYLAVSLILFCALAQAEESSIFYWAPLSALSPLIKPHGAILIACLMVLISLRFSWKKALVFGLLSFLPLVLWLARNHLISGTSTGYLDNWLSQASLPQNKGNPLFHIMQVVASLWGAAPLGAYGRPWALFPFWMNLGFGILLIAFFSRGVARLIKNPAHQELVFSLALYVILLSFLHFLWPAASVRYAIPFLPFVWIFVMAGLFVDSPVQTRNLGLILSVVIFIRCGAIDQIFISIKPRETPIVSFNTLQWVKRKTPASARIDTYDGSLFMLIAQRYAITAVANNQDNWIHLLIDKRFNYIEAAPFFSNGFSSSYGLVTYSKQVQWMENSPYFKKVYLNPNEGTVIYQFFHPHPKRFLRAYHDFEEAKIAIFVGYSRRRKFIQKELKEAVRLEPNLAYAWAALGSIETAPQKRLYYFERAAKADPSSDEIAEDLAKIRLEARRKPAF